MKCRAAKRKRLANDRDDPQWLWQFVIYRGAIGPHSSRKLTSTALCKPFTRCQPKCGVLLRAELSQRSSGRSDESGGPLDVRTTTKARPWKGLRRSPWYVAPSLPSPFATAAIMPCPLIANCTSCSASGWNRFCYGASIYYCKVVITNL
jgi:hypothetical protein